MTYSDFFRIDGERLLMFIFLFLALLFPGIIFMYLFKYEEFLKIELWQFIFISLFYSVPLFIFGFVYNFSNNQIQEKETKEKRNEKIENIIFQTSYQLVIISFGALILYYIFSLPALTNQLPDYRFFYYLVGFGIYFLDFSFKDQFQELYGTIQNNRLYKKLFSILLPILIILLILIYQYVNLFSALYFLIIAINIILIYTYYNYHKFVEGQKEEKSK